MTQVACPHCGAENSSVSAFCQTCGKAMPSAMPGGPRVVTANTLPQSSAGRTLVTGDLQRQMKKASGALLAVAILQAIFGPVMLFIQKSQLETQYHRTIEIPALSYAIVFGIAGAFFALWFWSRINPFAAAIVGLVLFVTIHAVDAIADPATL